MVLNFANEYVVLFYILFNLQDDSNTIYRGSKRICTKEFILVVDKDKKVCKTCMELCC